MASKKGEIRIDPDGVPESEAALGHNQVLAEPWEVEVLPPNGQKQRQQGPDRPDVVQYRPLPNPVDWESASRAVTAAKGTLAIAMDPEPKLTAQGLSMSDHACGTSRNDSGIVLWSGIPEISPGDRALVYPYTGEWFDGFELGGFRTDQMVRLFGISSTDEYELMRIDPLEDVPAIIEGERIVAKGHKLLIRRDPMVEDQGGVFLTPRHSYRKCCATIYSAGERSEYREGQRIVYKGRAIFGLDLSGLPLPGNPSDYAFIDSRNVYCLAEGNEKADRPEPAQVA